MATKKKVMKRRPEHRERGPVRVPTRRVQRTNGEYPERPRGASYTRGRDGDWLIRLNDLPPVAPGSLVKVRKKDGSLKNERLGRRLWSSEDDRVHLYTIHQEAASEPEYSDDIPY